MTLVGDMLRLPSFCETVEGDTGRCRCAIPTWAALARGDATATPETTQPGAGTAKDDGLRGDPSHVVDIIGRCGEPVPCIRCLIGDSETDVRAGAVGGTRGDRIGCKDMWLALAKTGMTHRTGTLPNPEQGLAHRGGLGCIIQFCWQLQRDQKNSCTHQDVERIAQLSASPNPAHSPSARAKP